MANVDWYCTKFDVLKRNLTLTSIFIQRKKYNILLCQKNLSKICKFVWENLSQKNFLILCSVSFLFVVIWFIYIIFLSKILNSIKYYLSFKNIIDITNTLLKGKI